MIITPALYHECQWGSGIALTCHRVSRYWTDGPDYQVALGDTASCLRTVIGIIQKEIKSSVTAVKGPLQLYLLLAKPPFNTDTVGTNGGACSLRAHVTQM